MKFVTVLLLATEACATLAPAQSFLDRHYKSEYRIEMHPKKESLPNGHCQSEYRDRMRFNKELVADSNYSAAITVINTRAAEITRWVKRAESFDSSWIVGEQNIALDAAFLELVEAAKLVAEEVEDSVGFASPTQDDVRQLKCYCDAHQGGWFYRSEEKVEWAIRLAENQTENYHWTLKSIEEFSLMARQLSAELDPARDKMRLQGGEEVCGVWTGLLSQLYAHDNLNKMRKHFMPSVWAIDGVLSLDNVADIISQRSLNITLLEKAPASFERAAASVDLACQMADLGKKASLQHRLGYSRATSGWCYDARIWA